MPSHKTQLMVAPLLLALLWGESAQASNRWDILKWCSAATQEDLDRCGGFLQAALDLTTHQDFAGPTSCFEESTTLADVRVEVVAWLKKNRAVPEQSGLALTARALRERFPCSN